ncbi:MAG: Argininosuccinate lyase [Candidatus Gottesmanbacteria bacterium GW2011_GWC2_39_8]|uniref:Argininosuccinate lyase n=1 Tax=Candidatus Gottesmanbacteria bacterium GW2011_GWC2_39_8 TaxID=1618450 RepID=A0A0G0PXC2_9BACT|nr:MAG: Argininosuccinate lyase [Candidatus Gottesmanbacteria bacterium GW2011_GWC2_39_8]
MKKSNLSQKVKNFIVSPAQMGIDHKMVPYDIWGTVSHVVMLYKTKIIEKEIAAEIIKALISIDHEYKEGNFQIDPEKGAQLTLESKIVEKAGITAGSSAHTARSRNDQVMVTEILYLKEEVLEILESTERLVQMLVKKAEIHLSTVIPGYTHMQPAKPTTFAHLLLSYAGSLLSGVENLKHTYQHYNQNPLGSVESYGTSWPIDREFTTNLLGFTKVWELPLEAISNRGFFQLGILSALNHVAIVASKIATDLLLYTTFEYGIVTLGDDTAKRLHPITGSSVMAQKKNPDVLELVRSLAPQIAGFYQIVSGILSKLPSGYNRDSREIKEYIDLGINKTIGSIEILTSVFSSLKVNEEKALKLVKENYSLTTDLADFLSQKSKIPYRLIYKIVGQVVDKFIQDNKLLSEISVKDINSVAKTYSLELVVSDEELIEVLEPVKATQKRKHIGGTNASITKTMIENKSIEMKNISKWVFLEKENIEKVKQNTWVEAKKIVKKAEL